LRLNQNRIDRVEWEETNVITEKRFNVQVHEHSISSQNITNTIQPNILYGNNTSNTQVHAGSRNTAFVRLRTYHYIDTIRINKIQNRGLKTIGDVYSGVSSRETFNINAIVNGIINFGELTNIPQNISIPPISSSIGERVDRSQQFSFNSSSPQVFNNPNNGFDVTVDTDFLVGQGRTNIIVDFDPRNDNNAITAQQRSGPVSFPVIGWSPTVANINMPINTNLSGNIIDEQEDHYIVNVNIFVGFAIGGFSATGVSPDNTILNQERSFSVFREFIPQNIVINFSGDTYVIDFLDKVQRYLQLPNTPANTRNKHLMRTNNYFQTQPVSAPPDEQGAFTHGRRMAQRILDKYENSRQSIELTVLRSDRGFFTKDLTDPNAKPVKADRVYEDINGNKKVTNRLLHVGDYVVINVLKEMKEDYVQSLDFVEGADFYNARQEPVRALNVRPIEIPLSKDNTGETRVFQLTGVEMNVDINAPSTYRLQGIEVVN